VRMNSILREEAQTALNKRTGCRLNASFNIEQCGSEGQLILRKHDQGSTSHEYKQRISNLS
jgi:hypothetical protein